MKDVKIIVCTHKETKIPNDKMYIPLLVGAVARKDEYGNKIDYGYKCDDTGDNISEKNKNLGTQTGLYWIWKNLDADYKGLVHYRRFFINKKVDKSNMLNNVITYEELKPMLYKYKVFVPKKRHYYIETLLSHYSHTFDKKHFEVVEKIIKKDCPEYINAFNKVMNRRWGYMFNMMILQNNLMDNYCSWLFNILFQAVEMIDKTNMTDFESRFGGRLSEILFDVWLEKKLEDKTITKEDIKELKYIEEVNWPFKIKNFLLAKFFHKKYGQSS